MRLKMQLLSKIDKKALECFPFPHAVIDDFLPANLCNKLIETYPDIEAIDPRAKENNFRFLYNMKDSQKDERISKEWKETLEYLSSPESFYEISSFFKEELLKRYPSTFKSEKQIKNLKVGIRGIHSYLTKDVLLDAQVRGNTGDMNPSCVQGAHIDAGIKIYSGLLYLRPENDDTKGGDLEVRELTPKELYKLSDKQKALKFYKSGAYIDPKYTKINKRVPYSKNTLFLFVNSLDSIHSVAERAPTKYTRKFIGFTAEMRKPLFLAQPTLKNRFQLLKNEYKFFIASSKLEIYNALSNIAWLKHIYKRLK